MDSPETIQRGELYAAFGHKGRRGFVAWLAFGGFLAPIEDEKDKVLYNDRMNVILSMIGDDQHEVLLRDVADVVLKLTRRKMDMEGEQET